MKSLNSIIIIILLVALATGSIFYVIKLNEVKEEAMALQSQLAKVDTVTVVDSTTVKRLSIMVDEIRLENTMLNQRYAKYISVYNKVILSLQDSIKNLNTKDTVIVHDNVNYGVRAFKFEKNPFYVEGTFMKQEPWFINFDVLSAKLALEILATENKNGTWETFVTTSNKSIAVTNVDARYKKFKSPKNKFILGAQAVMADKDITTSLVAGYEHSAIILGYGTNGMNLGVLYFFVR